MLVLMESILLFVFFNNFSASCLVIFFIYFFIAYLYLLFQSSYFCFDFSFSVVFFYFVKVPSFK